tara:strand:- start:493 stop:1068 length:576 start_codon:yes stop_codon:yes gene_type:complete
MSTLKTTNIKHASSSSNNIVLNNDGSTTFHQISNGVGKVLQVLQNVKTDTTSTSSSTYSDTGLSQAITPTSSSSKILVNCSVVYGGQNDAYIGFKVFRGTTPIGVSSEGSGNQSNVSFGGSGDRTHMEYMTHPVSWSYLDSPNTTSSTTYKIQYASRWDSNTIYINRPHIITDNGHVFYTTSTLTVMEVAT